MRLRLVARGLAALGLVAVLAACSSAPPAPEGNNDRKNRAADYLRFGRQAFQEAQYSQALSFYQIALDLNTSVDHVSGIVASWNAVASAQTALGQVAEARASLEQAEKLAPASNDPLVVRQTQINLILSDLDRGDPDSARKRLEAQKPFPDTAEGAALEHAWGSLEKDLGRWEAALAAFERARAINQRLGLKQEMASNLFMKASVWGRLARWDQAKDALEAALVLDRTMENTVGIGQDWRALGTVSLRLQAPDAAVEAYVRAFRVFQAAGLTDEQRRTVELLVPVLEGLGRAEERARYQAILERLTPRP